MSIYERPTIAVGESRVVIIADNWLDR